jgi:hypothetical protein
MNLFSFFEALLLPGQRLGSKVKDRSDNVLPGRSYNTLQGAAIDEY